MYAIPADRLYGLLNQGVDTTGMYVTMTSYSANPVYAEKALIWLCEQTNEEPPAWLDDWKEISGENEETKDEMPEIG